MHAAAPTPVALPGYDRNKLAKAIAIHETGNCTARVGAALKNNCFGFRANSTFYSFKSKEASYKKFHVLWAKSYGDKMPTIREATGWVCGWRWPTGKDCPGGSPRNWLASVTSLYHSF